MANYHLFFLSLLETSDEETLGLGLTIIYEFLFIIQEESDKKMASSPELIEKLIQCLECSSLQITFKTI